MDNETVISLIPKAQEAFVASKSKAWEADTTELLEAIAAKIKKATEVGRFVVAFGCVPTNEAEKAAIQLEALGYSTSVTADQPAQKGDGALEARCILTISWLHMPANKRDDYTV